MGLRLINLMGRLPPIKVLESTSRVWQLRLHMLPVVEQIYIYTHKTEVKH